MEKLKKIFFIFFSLYFIFFSKSVLATTFDLNVSTPGPYNRGQEVTFTINIDTEGATLNNARIGMTYDTQYLELVNTLPGETFPTVTTDNLGNGKLVFYGQSDNSFSGRGKFVDVVFKLIAQAPGSTELCVLWNPETTPTPQPNQSTQNKRPVNPTPPVSGDGKTILTLSLIGGTMVSGAILNMLLNNSVKKNDQKFDIITNKNKKQLFH